MKKNMKIHFVPKLLCRPCICLSLLFMVIYCAIPSITLANGGSGWLSRNNQIKHHQQANISGIHLQLGFGKLFYYHGTPKTIFIANTSIADFQAKTPGILYLTPKKVGETNIIGVDKHNHILFDKKLIVGLNKRRVMNIIHNIAPKSNIHVDIMNNTVILRGTAQYASEIKDILEVLHSSYKGLKVLNFLKVTTPPQIYLQVRVIEMSRSASRTIGVNWLAGYTGRKINFQTGFNGLPQNGGSGLGLGGSNTNNTTGDDTVGLTQLTRSLSNLVLARFGNFNISAVLEALENHGLATMLAEPNLTTLSGTSASFLAGGEFPIPVSQALGVTTIQFRDFGVSLHFTPTVIQKDLINLHINVDVSSLSGGGAVQANGFSIPGLSTRQSQVSVELHSGQNFAISGLLQKNINKVLRKFPGLGDLPILGALFRSKQFENNQSELVIIVTPYIVQPSSKPLSNPLNALPVKRYQYIHHAHSNSGLIL